MSEVDDILAPGGALSRVLQGYEPRQAQLSLAREVEAALKRGHHLVAEAGTGTGKTLAYLVPALLSGRTVVISTATKNLQEQVFFKDLPLLNELGLQRKVALLKGRSNYLCRARFNRFEAQPLFDAPEDAVSWPALRDWAGRTSTGDRAETELPDQWAAWARLSTTSESCAGSRCTEFERCHVTVARRKAAESQLIVVNHALFFADLALRAKGAQADLSLSVLPDYEAVVFDEAHALDEVATEAFGVAASSSRLYGLSQDAMRVAQRPDERAGLVATLALSLKEQSDAFFARASLTLALGDGAQVRLSEAMAKPLRDEAGPLLNALSTLAAACGQSSEEQSLDDVLYEAIERRAQEAAAALSFILERADPKYVYSAQQRGRAVWLKGAPIEAGTFLSQHLYEACDTTIFTSATLATTGAKPFDWAMSRLGLKGKDTRTLKVESPFDYQRQAALYLPNRLAEPNTPQFIDDAALEVERLCELTDGRAFVLFTSLKAMEAVYQRVANRLPGQVLKQGDRPRHALLESFVERPSVLFASQSFWEGVDVPGDALSLVIIDKLPFAPPNEPVTAARIEALSASGVDAFDAYQVPQAALALRQGFGRLIRTATDRGIVALLDVRVTRRRYGAAFLSALPNAQRHVTFEGVERFWLTPG